MNTGNRIWLKDINPLTKIAMSISLTINVFLLHSYGVLGTMFLLLLLMALSVDPERSLLKLSSLCILAGLPFTLFVFIVSGTENNGSLAGGAVWGLSQGGLFLLRLGILMLTNIILIKSTSLKELTETLRRFHLSEKQVLFISTMVRFIPISFEEAKRILDAQRCRGFRTKRFLNPKNMLPIVVPLFISQMKRAHDMALALEIRHFNWNKTFPARRLSFNLRDIVCWAVSIIMFSIPKIGG